jgi:hypothetical protein
LHPGLYFNSCQPVSFSFSAIRHYDDFLKQLGIGKPDADKRISNSILGGYFNAYGRKMQKILRWAIRSAVVKDVLDYTKNILPAMSSKNTSH